MKLLKFHIILKILVLTQFNISALISQDNDNIHYEFKHSENNYKFIGSSRVRADSECVLRLAFEYKHIKELAPQAEEVILVGQGDSWNQIQYVYKAFAIFRNETVWQRRLVIKEKRVDFSLISSVNNNSMMPEMISSSGYYKINKEEDFTNMEYYQEFDLTKDGFSRMYIKRLEKEAVEFLYLFSDYATRICGTYISE